RGTARKNSGASASGGLGRARSGGRMRRLAGRRDRVLCGCGSAAHRRLGSRGGCLILPRGFLFRQPCATGGSRPSVRRSRHEGGGETPPRGARLAATMRVAGRGFAPRECATGLSWRRVRRDTALGRGPRRGATAFLRHGSAPRGFRGAAAVIALVRAAGRG